VSENNIVSSVVSSECAPLTSILIYYIIILSINRNSSDMRPAAELGPSYRVQMHMQMQQQQYQHQHQHQTGSEYDEQPVSRTYQYRKVRTDYVYVFLFFNFFWFFVVRSNFLIRSVVSKNAID